MFFFIFAAVFAAGYGLDLAYGRPAGAFVIWYLIAGWAFYRYETKKDSLYWLGILIMKPGLWWIVVLVWPVFCVGIVRDSLDRRSATDRFTVNAEDFRSWHEAISVAREQATASGAEVYLIDNAKFRRQKTVRHSIMPPNKKLRPAMYTVDAQGKISRLFSHWH
jgi:hypothetical protein